MIYDGSFSRTLVPGQGIAAALLQAHGIRVLSELNFEEGLAASAREDAHAARLVSLLFSERRR